MSRIKIHCPKELHKKIKQELAECTEKYCTKNKINIQYMSGISSLYVTII